MSSFSLAAATALFTLAFGWAEFSSAGLRAQGFVVRALAPRDIGWRIAVVVLFGGAALAGKSFDAVSIMLAVAGILLVVVVPQTMMLLRSAMGATVKHLQTADRSIISRYSAVIWATTSAQWLRDTAGIVIVSAYLGAEIAGGGCRPYDGTCWKILRCRVDHAGRRRHPFGLRVSSKVF